ncbi:MAG: hypothetical protein V4685_09100 [Bacteroidota bacterium]
MAYFLFFFWLIVLSWLLTKIRFVKSAGLGSRLIIALFICKILAGLAAGWLAHNDINSDSWSYHQKGLAEYHLLFTNPREYFTNLFYTGYTYGYDGMLQTQNSFWNDLKDNLIIKLVSVFHIFSRGNYYVNVILYNFTIFFGFVGLYRVFKQLYQSNKLVTVAIVFLLPSVLFFGSAIHKDGLVLALVAVIVFNVWRSLQDRFAFKRVIFIFLSLLLLFFFRNFVLMALLPAMAAWILAEKRKLSAAKTFAVIYAATLLLFFTIQYILPRVNLPQYMVEKQADFFKLEKGNTTIQLDTLNAEPGSFLSVAPQAIQHGLLRPFITDVKLSKIMLPLSIELVFYEILILLFFVFRLKGFSFNRPFVLFCLLFGLSLCLIIGYTVPVIGAIVRYRSVYLPFITAPFILGIDWNRLATFAYIKK